MGIGWATSAFSLHSLHGAHLSKAPSLPPCPHDTQPSSATQSRSPGWRLRTAGLSPLRPHMGCVESHAFSVPFSGKWGEDPCPDMMLSSKRGHSGPRTLLTCPHGTFHALLPMVTNKARKSSKCRRGGHGRTPSPKSSDVSQAEILQQEEHLFQRRSAEDSQRALTQGPLPSPTAR